MYLIYVAQNNLFRCNVAPNLFYFGNSGSILQSSWPTATPIENIYNRNAYLLVKDIGEKKFCLTLFL